MADSPNLPGSHSWPPKSPGEWRDFYGFLRDLVRFVQQTSGNTDSLTAILARLDALENAPEPDLGQILGDMSVDVQGLLGQVVQLRLVNDATAPGTTYYYGTDADGTKGWHLLGDALLEGTGITLTVDGTTGEITIALADLADAGGGSFLLFTRDAQGRVSGSSAGDAGDVPYDDAGNTYVLGANVQAALDATDTALAGKQPLDSDLTAIAALSPANDDVIQRKAGAWTNRTMAQLLADLGIAAAYQPLDATLTALASQNWAANALPIGSGADTVSQVAFAANRFPARASTGNLEAKVITDGALSALAGSGGTAGWLRGDGTVSGTLVGVLSIDSSGAPGPAGSTAVLISGDGNKERIEARSYANGDPTFQGKQAGGTIGTPTATASGETLVQLGGSGHDGTDFVLANRGLFRIVSTETWTPTAQGTALHLITCSIGATSIALRWVVNELGFIPGADNFYALGSPSFRLSADYVVERNTSGAEYQTGIQSPAQFVANTDNFALTSTTRILRCSTDASRNLTGITGGASGRRLTLSNVGAQNLVLVHDATSTAANRFLCPGSANLTLNANDSAELWYDATSSRWRVIGV